MCSPFDIFVSENQQIQLRISHKILGCIFHLQLLNIFHKHKFHIL